MRHWPAIEYQTLVCNAIIVTICFYLLPTTFKNWLFSEFHGKQAFVMVLVSWMISDVISTNLLGHDPDNALRALENPNGIARLVRVKACALALCVGGVGSLTALILGGTSHDVARALTILPMCFGMPLVTVCIGSLVGVLAPYRLRTARWRWENRKRYWMNLRWALLIFIPTWFLGSIASLLSFPLHLLTPGPHTSGPMTFLQALIFPGVITCETVFIFLFIPQIAQHLSAWRNEKLHDYLTSDTAG